MSAALALPAPAATRRRGQPLVALVLILGGWVAVRAVELSTAGAMGRGDGLAVQAMPVPGPLLAPVSGLVSGPVAGPVAVAAGSPAPPMIAAYGAGGVVPAFAAPMLVLVPGAAGAPPSYAWVMPPGIALAGALPQAGGTVAATSPAQAPVTSPVMAPVTVRVVLVPAGGGAGRMAARQLAVATPVAPGAASEPAGAVLPLDYALPTAVPGSRMPTGERGARGVIPASLARDVAVRGEDPAGDDGAVAGDGGAGESGVVEGDAPGDDEDADARPRARRVTGDTWALLRGGGAPAAFAAGTAGYGGSQAGGVLRFHLAPGSARDPAIYLRTSSTLRAVPTQSEIAAGVSLKPLAGLPVMLLGEARQQQGSGRRVVRPAAMAVTALPPFRLPLGAEGEFYGAAGWVGGPGATGFYDAQLTADRPLFRFFGKELRVGVGAWAGGQKGAHRLDLGPRADVRLPIGRLWTRAALDWRFRVAGHALPGSGPALTLSAGF